MAAEAQRATGSRGQTSFAARIAKFWRRIEPGIAIDRDNFIERWDGQGEGRATAYSFEGFGVTMSLHIGATPPSRTIKPYFPEPRAPRFSAPADSLAATHIALGGLV